MNTSAVLFPVTNETAHIGLDQCFRKRKITIKDCYFYVIQHCMYCVYQSKQSTYIRQKYCKPRAMLLATESLFHL